MEILVGNVVLFYASFFSPFLLGAMSFAFFGLIALNNSSFRIKYLDVILCCGLLVLFSVKAGLPLTNSIQCFRFFFGFYFIYLVLRQSNFLKRIDLNVILLIFCLSTFAEFIGVNFFGMDPNSFATKVFRENHKTILFGMQRPVGLTGSPSTTAAVIISLLVSNFQLRQVKPLTFLFSLLALLLSYSGVGLVIFVIYLALLTRDLFKRHKSRLFRLVVVGLVLSCLVLLTAIFLSGQMTKMSSWYFSYIVDFKRVQISDYIQSLADSYSNFLIGLPFDSREGLYGGDFAWLDFLSAFGFIGIVFYFLMFLGSVNRYNCLALVILLFGNLHYGTITSVAGQIVTAYFMALRREQIPVLEPAKA